MEKTSFEKKGDAREANATGIEIDMLSDLMIKRRRRSDIVHLADANARATIVVVLGGRGAAGEKAGGRRHDAVAARAEGVAGGFGFLLGQSVV